MNRAQIGRRARKKRRATLERRITRQKKRIDQLKQKKACAEFHEKIARRELGEMQAKLASLGGRA